jgi:hypothetical protein
MRLRKNIATSESGLIFNPVTGDSFSVNGTGADILIKLRENTTEEDIIKYLSSKYDVDAIQLEKDMDDFFSLLNEYNLLEK